MGQDDQVGQGEAADVSPVRRDFERLLRAEDAGKERRIFWQELAIGALMAILLFVYLIVS
jgi:hypothetical protein